MYATAHRVVSPTTRVEGVNTFYYLHDRGWDGAPPLECMPETDPGTLVDKAVAVPPPGNRVRSYLDILAPDGTTLQEIEHALTEVLSADTPTSLPAVWTSGRFWFRFGVELSLVPVWRHELQLLLESISALLSPATNAP
jgi:hypothetical protein